MALTSYARAFSLAARAESEGATLVSTTDGRRIGLQGSASDELVELVRDFLGAYEGREFSPHYRAMGRMLRAPSLAVREVLTLPVRALGSYPVPYTAHGTAARQTSPSLTPGPLPSTVPSRTPNHWAWSTSRGGFSALIESGVAAFTGKELERAAYALEHGRAGPSDIARWCGAKAGRDWVLTPELARAADLRGYVEGKTFSTLTVGELLDGLGAELISVEMHEPKGG